MGPWVRSQADPAPALVWVRLSALPAPHPQDRDPEDPSWGCRECVCDRSCTSGCTIDTGVVDSAFSAASRSLRRPWGSDGAENGLAPNHLVDRSEKHREF